MLMNSLWYFVPFIAKSNFVKKMLQTTHEGAKLPRARRLTFHLT